ncbi:MAG: protoheme IX farnesyltransferase [Gemmatimonadales bacterium]|nr:protoheme IX farnesyltransferase [Gemmatimonadales bacterium]
MGASPTGGSLPGAGAAIPYTNSTDGDRARLLRRVAWSGAGLAFGLIVLGGVVRITGSGMGCGDHWPRCNGEWFPPLDLPTMIEIGHRWAAALVSLSVFTVAFVAWRRHRTERFLWAPAALAVAILVAQVLLGAVTVKLELPPWVVVTHLANAMLLLGALVVVALRATPDEATRAPLPRSSRHPAHRLVVAAAGLGFAVILLGAQVANFHAGLLCLGFPLCNGELLPPAAPLAALHWTHRAFAFAFLCVVGVLVARLARRTDPEARQVRRWAALLLAATVTQIGVAAAMVLSLLPGELRALHLLVGTLVWVALVALTFHSARTPAEAPVNRTRDPVARGARRPSLLADLVTLTKPRIISLLLVTTIAPMFITPAGLPTVSQVCWVLLAGYLMAGGANTINMWFDRDIDTRMSRTRLRPIPSGRIAPELGLAYGVALGFSAFAIFWYRVNPLSAWLALAGLLFYVFVYTVWLKRSSPQNIVIGGAAGAFPPLVGWAAMTGGIDLSAIYLFAIVFYWTPPHFWALALIKQADYARAGIPMMPVVWGEARTKYEMLVYTLILLPLTILPVFFGALGPFYAVAAALLGARLLWYCIRLRREAVVTPVAWGMYRYSLLYLALLFVAMGVDRALPYGGPRVPARVIILDRASAIPAASPNHLGH